jgi:hypothetical protein
MRFDQEKDPQLFVSNSSSPLKNYWFPSSTSEQKLKKRIVKSNQKELSILWGLIKIKW